VQTIFLAKMRQCARYAGQPTTFAHADPIVEPVDLTVARANFARVQRLNRFSRALLKNTILERAHVRWGESSSRHDKSLAAGQLKRYQVPVELKTQGAHHHSGNLFIKARVAIAA
jgi:hypothetical protein